LPANLATTITNIEKKIKNQVNRIIVKEFFTFLKNQGISENYQNGLFKVLIRYAEYLGSDVTFYQNQDKEQIIKYLDLKRKTVEDDSWKCYPIQTK
jgi:hypothetical protein